MPTSSEQHGMFLYESGDPGSPAILFLHGAGQSGREWSRHMTWLSDFHCLAPDLPGHGRSRGLPLTSKERLADDLAALIEARVPSGRAFVAGVSWGANLAQILLRRHPERVSRLISDGTIVAWPGGAVGTLLVALYGMLVPFLHTRPVLALYRDIVDSDDLRLTSRLAYWRAVRHCAAGIHVDAIAACPVLLVAGEKEGSVRPHDAALAAFLPQAQAWYAPSLGHCWHRMAPELHCRMVEAWCTTQELPAGLRRELPPKPAEVERLRRAVGVRA